MLGQRSGCAMRINYFIFYLICVANLYAEIMNIHFDGSGAAYVNGIYIHGDTTLDLQKPISVKAIQNPNQRLYFVCLDSVVRDNCDLEKGAWFAGRNLSDSLAVHPYGSTSQDHYLSFKFVADSLVLPDSLVGPYILTYNGPNLVKMGPTNLTDGWAYFTRFNKPMSFPGGYNVGAYLYASSIKLNPNVTPIQLIHSVNSAELPSDWSFNQSFMQIPGYPYNPPKILDYANLVVILDSIDSNNLDDVIKLPSSFDSIAVQNIQLIVTKDTIEFGNSWFLIKGEFEIYPGQNTNDVYYMKNENSDTIVPVRMGHSGGVFEFRDVKAPFRIGYQRQPNDLFRMNVRAFPKGSSFGFEGIEQTIIRDAFSKGSAVFVYDSSLIKKGVYPNILVEIDIKVDRSTTPVQSILAPFLKSAAGWQYTGTEKGRWKRYTLSGQWIGDGLINKQDLIPFAEMKRSVLIVDIGTQHWVMYE